MKKCLKCGFENDLNDSEACPKCGAVYSKIERLMREKKHLAEKTANERAFSDKVASQMEEEEAAQEDLSKVFGDETHWWERNQYSYVDYLTGTFLFFGFIVILVDIVGGYWLYKFSQYSDFISPQDKVFLFVFYGCYVILSAACVFTIPAILKMLKDTTNNTRITSEILKHLSDEFRGRNS